MKKMLKITALKKIEYKDLMDEFELPQLNACNIKIGDIFLTDGINKPTDLCDSAWLTLKPFIDSIINKKPLFENWMKDKSKAIVSCNDGFRPVSFLIEDLGD
ncbi:MAG: TIGR04076 family protein [Acholeplasmatales bacterium]|nr:TIGR04076 family protein [Acholeplasmatales bacterium]